MDATYKRLYSVPRMVADLVRAVAPDLARRIDFSTLEDLSAETVGTRGQQRRGDKVWRARLRGGGRILLLLEFQSDKSAGIMPLRVLEYTALQLVQLHLKRRLGTVGQWPAVLPIVLYCDAAPWTEAVEMRGLFAPVDAALAPHLPSQRLVLLDELRAEADDMPPGNLTRVVVGLEQSRLLEDLVRVTEPLDRWIGGDDRLRGVFADWIREMAEELAPGAPPIRTLEEARMTLVERIAEWPKPWIEQGMAEGRKEGLTLGREQGIAEGLADQRALLRRLAASRFGAAAGDRLAAALARVADAERLADAGELIVSCSNAEELIARLGQLHAMPVNGVPPRGR